jgi:hypothetical protein
MVKDRVSRSLKRIIYVLAALAGAFFIFLGYTMSKSVSDTNAGFSFSVFLSISIPVIAIWIIALHGAVKLREYSSSIRQSQDGDSLHYIANALLALVAYIILLSTASTVFRLFMDTPYLDDAVIISNLLPLSVALISVSLLFKGSSMLAAMTKVKHNNVRMLRLLAIPCVALFAGYAWLFYSVVPYISTINGMPRFVMPIAALLLVYVLPHIVLWVYGLLACVNLAHYANHTTGSIYKTLFKNLYRGLLVVYLSIFLAQIFIISPVTYQYMNIGIVLIYGLLVLAAFGFILIDHGVNRLSRVEELSVQAKN